MTTSPIQQLQESSSSTAVQNFVQQWQSNADAEADRLRNQQAADRSARDSSK